MLLKLVEIETVYRAIDALAPAASRLCERSGVVHNISMGAKRRDRTRDMGWLGGRGGG